MELGLEPVFAHGLSQVGAGEATFACLYTGRERTLVTDNLLLVTGRLPERTLYDDLMADQQVLESAGIKSVTRIGDCLVPSSIADAVYRGHSYARSLEEPKANAPLPRERPALANGGVS